MVEAHNPTEVEDLLQKEPHGELTAILTPTKMDIINFADAMATALTSCKSKLALIDGQTYLVLNEAEFKLRVQDKTEDIPVRSQKPKKYDHTNYDTKTWKVHKHALVMYEETRQYDQQIISLIKTKFPQGLEGLYDDCGNLILGTTAFQAIKQVSENIVDKS